ncbi:protein MCM10 homolog isoform X2 [Esox lucius]|uniref:protein MCM10 homolog isoform X2 n=1 Tax=Esox lucius TaxID=8010 RepID=UPI001476BEB5|nr:protein MCM10 homolog isoform X2 [Esox lucius]
MRPIDGFDGYKMSSQHAELQSSFSGKVKGKTNNLNERLCQTGFYYSGLSSTASLARSSSGSKKPTQTTLGNLFVKGANQLSSQARRLALVSDDVTGHSDHFMDLLSLLTLGAPHQTLSLPSLTPPGSVGLAAAGVQSILASDLLKRQ